LRPRSLCAVAAKYLQLFPGATEDRHSEDAEEAMSVEHKKVSEEQLSSTQVEQVQPGWLGRRA